MRTITISESWDDERSLAQVLAQLLGGAQPTPAPGPTPGPTPPPPPDTRRAYIVENAAGVLVRLPMGDWAALAAAFPSVAVEAADVEAYDAAAADPHGTLNQVFQKWIDIVEKTKRRGA